MTSTEFSHACRHNSRVAKLAKNKKLGKRFQKKTVLIGTGFQRFSNRAWRNETRRGIRASRSRKSFSSKKIYKEKDNAITHNENDHDCVNDDVSSKNWLRRWMCTDCYNIIDCDENKILMTQSSDYDAYQDGVRTNCNRTTLTEACDLDLKHVFFDPPTTPVYNMVTDKLVNIDIK